LLAEVANYGTALARRVYGDCTDPKMKWWRECLLEHSTMLIQQFAYTTEKNATDGPMIIGAFAMCLATAIPRALHRGSSNREHLLTKCSSVNARVASGGPIHCASMPRDILVWKKE
jgi:hypothetical protein